MGDGEEVKGGNEFGGGRGNVFGNGGCGLEVGFRVNVREIGIDYGGGKKEEGEWWISEKGEL